MATRPPRILLADDNRDDHLLLVMAAEQARIVSELRFADHGADLLQQLSREHAISELPDLIVLDLKMPYVDGRQTLAALKADAIYMDIPVVILTSSSSIEDRVCCEDLGASRYTVKPSSFRAMVELTASLDQLARQVS